MGTPTTRRDFLTTGAAGLTWAVTGGGLAQEKGVAADLILTNGRIATLDRRKPDATAVAIRGGRFVAVGDDKDVLAHKVDKTQVVDLQKRAVIPGLNDSHLHLIRGGLNYNLELRWDGVPSLADALRMLKEQAKRTPPPQWVRVVGGWSELQFKERRMPTLEEINAAAPDTPVFVLHLYDRAWLNKAALRAVAAAAKPDPVAAGNGKPSANGKPHAAGPSRNGKPRPAGAGKGVSREDVATEARVSEYRIRAAARLERLDKRLFRRVVAGKVRLGDAVKEVINRNRLAERQAVAATVSKLAPQVRNTDFRTGLGDLPADSVDLIFTDPPYDTESIPLYGDLARLAARVPAPGGSLVCYAACPRCRACSR